MTGDTLPPARIRDTAVLVVAKAPAPGVVKTRLALTVGDRFAAELAAAALLDTIEVCAAAFDTCLLALTGELAGAARGDELVAALSGWSVFGQRGDGLGERLVNAHGDAARRSRRPVLQVGMDTPQMGRDQLSELAGMLSGQDCDAVLGPADDGGWWLLGVTAPALVEGLASVPMSSGRTCAETLRMLHGNGASVLFGPQLRDVDVVGDAVAVSRDFPHLEFAARWAASRPASHSDPRSAVRRGPRLATEAAR